MKLRPVGHALDGGDRASFDLDRQQKTAQLRTPIDKHGASAAFAELAAMLRARELHVLAQHLEERLVYCKVQLGALAVDIECDDLALHVARHLVLHWASIVFTALAHSHRSGATACARLEAGLGSSG